MGGGARITEVGGPDHSRREHSRHEHGTHDHGLHGDTSQDNRVPSNRVPSNRAHSNGRVPLPRRSDPMAERTRRWLAQRRVLAVNLLGPSGAGATTLVEHTLRTLGSELRCGVVEADQETTLDSERLGATGCRVVQINTGTGCHLDADMVEEGLRSLQPAARSLVFVENVGGLDCGAAHDLGETLRVVLFPVTEGADKPLKHPAAFASADLVLLTKVDLLDHVEGEAEEFTANARSAHPQVPVLQVAAAHGTGLDAWCGWLREQRGAVAG